MNKGELGRLHATATARKSATTAALCAEVCQKDQQERGESQPQINITFSLIRKLAGRRVGRRREKPFSRLISFSQNLPSRTSPPPPPTEQFVHHSTDRKTNDVTGKKKESKRLKLHFLSINIVYVSKSYEYTLEAIDVVGTIYVRSTPT